MRYYLTANGLQSITEDPYMLFLKMYVSKPIIEHDSLVIKKFRTLVNSNRVIFWHPEMTYNEFEEMGVVCESDISSLKEISKFLKASNEFAVIRRLRLIEDFKVRTDSIAIDYKVFTSSHTFDSLLRKAIIDNFLNENE